MRPTEGEPVGVPGDLADEVELIDALLKPLGERPVDITEPGWISGMRERPAPLDEANVREEAEAALRELLALYERGDERTRRAVRALLNRCASFCWAVSAPRGRTPEALRRQLLYLSARDQCRDPRDEMVWLNDLCEVARDAQVDIRSLLLEVAALSSAEDRYGMGSVRDILHRAAGRDPVGLW
ncbi:hypothetical protein ABZ614_45795 [Streptomyces sp. NPDC013178]|uniref:hypothetical protein n=1 Tax=Streptomyces sp. NPDC013178 TaxID=3155118 RepID=UPI0033C6A267